MPENSGSYRVAFEAGKATDVELADAAPDLSVTEETLCQLIVGRIDLNDARYRMGTVVQGNEGVLASVFTRCPVSLDL